MKNTTTIKKNLSVCLNFLCMLYALGYRWQPSITTTILRCRKEIKKRRRRNKKTGSYISLRLLLLSIKLTTFIYFVFIGWKIDWLIGIKRVNGKKCCKKNYFQTTMLRIKNTRKKCRNQFSIPLLWEK